MLKNIMENLRLACRGRYARPGYLFIVSIYVVLGVILTCYAQTTAQTLTLAANTQQFNITLPANPTTGYSWTLMAYDNRYLQVVSHAYQAPTSGLAGAPGQEIWVFHVLPGAKPTTPLTLQFRYARPWNVRDNPSFQTISILFQ